MDGRTDGWMDGWMDITSLPFPTSLFHLSSTLFVVLSSFRSSFFFFRFFHSRPFPSSLRTGKPVGIRHSGDKNLQLSSKSTELNTFNFLVYGFSHPSAASQLQLKLLACVEEVSMWMRSNRLQLNPANTEVLWLSSSRICSSIFHSPRSVWGIMLSHLPPLFVTWEFILTRVSQWPPIFPRQCQIVLLHWDKSVVSAGLFPCRSRYRSL